MLGNSKRGASNHIQQSAIKKRKIMEEETPLVIASKKGNLKEVRRLVEEAKVNVDQRSYILAGNRYFRATNGSALHAAVIAGQTQIVNYLVDCYKVDINAKTQSLNERNSIDHNSTALHLAVSHLSGDVQKEIVTCLLTHGADWTIVDDKGMQCWELAYELDDVEITKVLINFRVGLDSSRNSKSLHIAHMWAKPSLLCNKGTGEVVALAIDKGIKINEPDPKGFTPLMIAAVGLGGHPNCDVVNVIFKKTAIPSSHLKTALKLIGAALLFRGNFYGLELWKRAMKVKITLSAYRSIANYQFSDDIKSALNVTSEVHSIKELESIAHDLDLLQVQAHLIRIRILGLEHSETLNCLTSHALKIFSKDPQRFFKYLHLILKGIGSPEHYDGSYSLFDSYDELINLSLFAITQKSNSMPHATVSTFNNAMPILRKLVILLNQSDSAPFTIDFMLDTIVNLTHIMLHGEPLTSQENFDLKCCLRQAVRLRKRNTDGFDLFLLACSETEVPEGDLEYREEDYEEGIDDMEEEFVDTSFQRCTSAKTISIFIEVGGDVDSVTNEGDTAFHVLAKKTTSFESMVSFEMLYHAGVHLDQTNLQGKTIIDILRGRGIFRRYASIIPACLMQQPSLKCLCARLVPKNHIPLLEHFPGLSEFVMRHGKKNNK